jgi:hypothetical protein
MDFSTLLGMFNGGGAGATVNPPTAGALTPGQSPGPGWGTATQQGQGALNYLGNAAMQRAMNGGGGGGNSGGAGAGGMNASGGYMGGHL